jgi:hypothetical protein
MKKIVLLMLVIFNILSCTSVQNVNKLVSNLGLEKCPMCQIKELYINPHKAARLLLNELHAVEIINKRSDEMIKTNPETYHIIWCIRGLQFLTGKVFVANTNEKKVYEIQDFDGKMNPIPFFKDWMSREYIMIAPQDVQIQIINEWKEYIKNNPDFKVRNYSFNDDLYF